MSKLNDEVIAEFRANLGLVKEAHGGYFKDVHLLLLHHTGRRTGRELITPLIYLADDNKYVLLGSDGGAQHDPAWVANIEAMPKTVVEVGDRVVVVWRKILRGGPERDRLYARFVEYWPPTTTYEAKTQRSFPIVVLEPIS